MQRLQLVEPISNSKEFFDIISKHATVHGSAGGVPVCPMMVDCTISEEGIKLMTDLGVSVK